MITEKDQKAIARYYGYEMSRITTYEEFEKFISNGNNVQYGQLRYYDDRLRNEHNIMLYNYNGGWYVSDVGKKENHGISVINFLGKNIENFRYYQFLLKIKK
ncbi:MAG: hypothetical protein WBK20_10815 [Spirochaetota bacterium]